MKRASAPFWTKPARGSLRRAMRVHCRRCVNFFAGATLPQVSLRAPELGEELNGFEALSARAHDLLETAPLSFALNSVEIGVSGSLARVEAELLVSVRGGGEQRREVRHTRVRLAKREERWRIEAVEVDPIAPSEPEARP